MCIEILDNNLWLVLSVIFQQEIYNKYNFQDDNFLVYRMRVAQEFIARNRIIIMSWPTQSPDLKLIENIWLYGKKKTPPTHTSHNFKT